MYVSVLFLYWFLFNLGDLDQLHVSSHGGLERNGDSGNSIVAYINMYKT
jgi:hypothetical protein